MKQFVISMGLFFAIGWLLADVGSTLLDWRSWALVAAVVAVHISGYVEGRSRC